MLIGLALTVAGVYAAAAESKKTATEEKSPPVSDVQVGEMKNIMDQITNCKQNGPSSPEELFKIISGEIQTTTRELPVQGAVTEANAKGYRIVCYQEGSETVVASTDPTLLGKHVADIKTSEGEPVRDRAVKELKKSSTDEAVFTYNAQQNTDALPVDGKVPSHTRVVLAAGRNAFKSFPRAEKKFLCTIGADAK